MRDDDQVHFLQQIGFDRVSRAIVQKGIDQNAAAIGVNQFIGGHTEEADSRVHVTRLAQ